MLDPHSVISQASEGIVKKLAGEYEVTERRMYAILEDSPYIKARKLIRRIAHHNQDGARLIKADMDALFNDILEDSQPATVSDLHSATADAIQSLLTGKSSADVNKALRTLISVAERAMTQEAEIVRY